jgi:hypothetical protein
MRALLLLAGTAIFLALPQAPVQAQVAPSKVDEELVEKVRKSIDLAKNFLIRKQNKTQGTWEEVVLGVLADMEGGQTALVTLALLNSGMEPNNPAMVKALDYLRTLKPKKTYVVALQNLVFLEARQSRDLPIIQSNAEWLIQNAIGFKNGAGRLEGWSYPGNTISDNSNTQYALLGLYAAKQAGIKIEDKVWRAIQEYYVRTQVSESPTSGKWAYYPQPNIKDSPSFSMTVAGTCGLIIAGMGLDESEQNLNPDTGVAANCGVYSANTPLAKGMNWIGANFEFESLKSTFYNIYGIERLGRLSGQRFIDRYDWYRDGCIKLIGLQQLDGEKKGAIYARGKGVDGSDTIATSFALLFLSKGRTPVLISKFAWGKYQSVGNGSFREEPTGPEGQVNWNRKHNDTRHLVEFCSKEIFNGVPLSWQVYDVRRRDFGNDPNPGGKSSKEKILEEVGSLLQSPVLYLNGHGPLVLSPVQEEIIKTYLEEGGFLVAEACCGDPVFAKSFRTLMKKLFPDNDLKRMPPEHAIWKMFPGITPLDFPDVEVLERGCRTVCVFSPTPLAGYWEEEKYTPKDPRKPTSRGEKAYCLARNIVAYATGMELPKPKLSFQKVERGGPDVGVSRSYFKAAQLALPGESEPAPDALKNLMSFLRDHAHIETARTTAVVSPFDDSILRFKFCYMHGRKPLTYTEEQLENLASNLQTGGLLLADAACNGTEQWKAFDASFREMCTKLFPKSKLEVIPEKTEDGKEEPLFKIAREAGINLKTVRCRRETANGQPEPEMHNYPPYLEGIKIDGRWVVIYSKYDIGCAIEGHKAADCLGHDKESALRIASAVVLYSLKR